MLGGFCRAAAAAIVVGSSLGLPGLGVARADLVFPPSSLDTRCCLSARLWGMGGAATALAGSTDQLPAGAGLANPAAAGFTAAGVLEVELTYMPQDGAGGTAQAGMSEEPSPLWIPAGDDTGAAGLTGFTSAGPGQLPGQDGLYAGLARSGGPGRQWAWGMSTEVSPSADLTLVELGVVRRSRGGFSLSLGWSGLSSAGGNIAQASVVGAAYEAGPWAVAADLFGSAEGVAPRTQAFAGVEYRMGDGLALRAGSAAGHRTYGIGRRMGRWQVDLARVSTDGERVVLPGTILEADSDVTVLSLSWME